MRDCVFCAIVAGAAPASTVHTDERFCAFMDLHPWRPGHLLVVPRAHHARVGELPAGDAEALFGLGVRLAGALRASGLPCDDVHFLVNDGAAANQTVPHAHLHVIPRARGDLWRLVVRLLGRVAPLVPAPRDRLDREATRIRAALPGR